MIAPLVGHPPPKAPLQRIVDHEDKRFISSEEDGYDQVQQDLAQGQRRPDGVIEDAVIGREMALILQADGAQSGRHTVRRPDARSVPYTRTTACAKVGAMKAGAKTTSRCPMADEAVGIAASPPEWRDHLPV